MRYRFFFLIFLSAWCATAQITTSNYRTKKIIPQDSILLDTVSINPAFFDIRRTDGTQIDSTLYSINYASGMLRFSSEGLKLQDSLTVSYLKYPQFITREYFKLDPKIIVDENGAIEKLYSLQESTRENNNTPFQGLNSVGSISRGITVGNNQNAVVNSELDLQITGKLSDKVSIRASIQDANAPTQDGGYSQSLNEFDQIFIELFSDNWNIRAGDVNLTNQTSYFGNFTKKVQGISLGGTLNHKNGGKTQAFAAGALVRGVFSQSNFVGQEGNQGPYKLVGPNGELFILIVSGSERVYVNGVQLERGENKDYIIDYNAGEVKFNPTYPITANMRIRVEYQYTDRNYTRFIGYGGGGYSNETFDVNVYVYSENDAKNQPLQQNLSEEQVAILQAAGDDMDLMTAPSAVPDTFSENKILYRKEIINGFEAFVFSNDPEDELFSVRFSLVGEGNGNYIISSADAISRIFVFVPPVGGVPQGNYEPIVRLNAPTKLQIGGIHGSYHPSAATNIAFELAGSQNDLNLFSSEDDGDNDGFAARLKARQNIVANPEKWTVAGFGSLDYINEDFRNIERIYNVEFNRDWNLFMPEGDQRFLTVGAEALHANLGNVIYRFENLNFSESFNGTRQGITSNVKLNNLRVLTNANLLNTKSDSLNSDFFRLQNITSYSFEKAWVGGKVNIENNKLRNARTDSLTVVSQKYEAYEMFAGVGDSTAIYVAGGFRYRTNDSVRNNKLERVNSSRDYFLKSRLLNKPNSQLTVFANYRELKDEDGDRETEKSLNSRIVYAQGLVKGGIRLNTLLESNNGVIPQQEFTYVQVDEGQGVFTWNDYNNNGIQELDEFEVAQFQDQADYVRILLPNQVFVRIRQNKFSQIITLNPQQWSSATGFKKILSKFYNQTSYVLDRRVRRNNDGFNISPFKDGDEEQLGLTLNFRNALFFNRGKQRYTTSYTYISTSTSNLLSLGLQESKLESHQLNFTHKVGATWLFNLKGSTGSTESISENFSSRNFLLDTRTINPKVSYLLNPQTRFDIFYSYLTKQNELGMQESLDQQRIGASFSYANAEKVSMNGEFNYIDNTFEGSAFSPVAYQILEGLQPGVNYTWSALLQKRITKYLDVNISYFGRKSEANKAIHTGSVQLRAFF